MKTVPLSPLSLDQLTRDLWGQYDGAAIAQIADLAAEGCYQPKFYKAPADDQEVMQSGDYATYGLKITPGSIIYGLYLPCDPVQNEQSNSAPPQFNVQITDVTLKRKWFDDPIWSLFLANYKPTFQSQVALQSGSFPNLLPCPYPVVGSGLFMVELWNTSDVEQRIELVFGVLEVCG